MEVTYDYYRIFYYAAKYKSFSQAATILMSNQPNVTRAIHNLESQLGCRLFIRSNRGAELTPHPTAKAAVIAAHNNTANTFLFFILHVPPSLGFLNLLMYL